MTSCELIPAKDVKAQNLVFGRFVITFLGNPYETSATSCVMIKNNVSLEKSCGLSIEANQGPRQKSIVLSGQSKKRVPYGILTSVYSVPKWVFFLLKNSFHKCR